MNDRHREGTWRKHIPSKAVKGFPHLFRNPLNANLVSTFRLLKSRQQVFDRDGNIKTTGITSYIRPGTNHHVKQLRVKAKMVGKENRLNEFTNCIWNWQMKLT